MELKELLGDDLYKQVQAKIDEKNSTETDKLKHVRYTDLSEGKYVSKEKYDSELEKLNELITGKDTEIGNANKLIEDLKKASKGDEGMQQKISTYETENARLQKELEETKVNSAIKVALLEAHAVDTDYMTYETELTKVLYLILDVVRHIDESMYEYMVNALVDGVRLKLDGREFGRMVRNA